MLGRWGKFTVAWEILTPPMSAQVKVIEPSLNSGNSRAVPICAGQIKGSMLEG